MDAGGVYTTEAAIAPTRTHPIRVSPWYKPKVTFIIFKQHLIHSFLLLFVPLCVLNCKLWLTFMPFPPREMLMLGFLLPLIYMFFSSFGCLLLQNNTLARWTVATELSPQKTRGWTLVSPSDICCRWIYYVSFRPEFLDSGNVHGLWSLWQVKICPFDGDMMLFIFYYWLWLWCVRHHAF